MTIPQHIGAAIDLGSNTFRLLVAGIAAGSLTVLDKKLATVRLGRGLQETGILQEHSMQKGLEVLRSFRKSLVRFRPQHVRICGTEALRRGRNSQVFLQGAEETLQHQIDIISSTEEAMLSLAGALSGHHATLPPHLLLVDAGGSSTELVFLRTPSGEISVESMALGVVGLTEKFLGPLHPDLQGLDSQLTETCGRALANLRLPGKSGELLIIGCGGTATSMAALDLNLASYNGALVHGHLLHSYDLQRLWSSLTSLGVKERNALPGLGDGRGEILPAGIRMYQVLLQLLHRDTMRVSDTGLLEGILLSSLPDAIRLDLMPRNSTLKL